MSSLASPADRLCEAIAAPPSPQPLREFLEGLVRGMRCGIVAVDRRGDVVLINRVARQILDLADDATSGPALARTLGEHPQLVEILRESFSVPSLPNRAELELWPGTAEAKTIGFTVSLVAGPTGQPIGAALFFKDLTQIEHQEEQARLKDRLAALGEMAASMAHEIRNPLAAIDVSCTLLRRHLATTHGDDPRCRDLLDKITAEIQRLNRTIGSSLEFVRPLVLELEHHGLEPLLEEAIQLARRAGSRAAVVVDRRNATAIPPFLMDREKLRQVFENLVLNSLEAMGERGTVTIETEMRRAPGSVPEETAARGAADRAPGFEHVVIVRISDTGPGIPDADKARVFFPFYTTKKQGSGVGLALAKKIVNSHRGRIDVADAPTGGALFTVRLPMILERVEA